MRQPELIVGDSLVFTTSVANYPASAGYTLKYRLIRRDAAGAAIEITASASGDDYAVNVAPATTATWTAGHYTWSAWVEKVGERHTFDAGELRIKPDPATQTAPYDDRSHAVKTLAAIEAVIEGRATSAQQQWAIAGRQVQYIPVAELLRLRNTYRAEVRAENDANRRAQGLKPRTSVAVRFRR